MLILQIFKKELPAYRMPAAEQRIKYMLFLFLLRNHKLLTGINKVGIFHCRFV